MALNLNLSTTIRNSGLDAITTAIGSSGKLRIYDGTQPATVATAITSQVLLADLALSATSAPGASGGVLTFNSITNDSSADNTGTASWGSLLTSSNVRVADFTVGTSGTDMIINNTSITATQVVSCSALTITAGNA